MTKTGSTLTTRYFIAFFVAVFGGSLQFYNFCIVNPLQSQVTEWINETYSGRYQKSLTEANLNLIWSSVTGVVCVGALIGALLVRVLSEKLGRRNALLINGFFNLMGALIVYFSKAFRLPELLFIGRFILGVNLGIVSGLVPIYLMELTPARHRGVAGTLHMVAIAFSDWFSLLIGLPEILGNAENWPIAFALPGLPALVLCLVLPFCPESPKHLLMTKGDREGAYQSLVKIVGEANARGEFHKIIKESALDMNLQQGSSFIKLFTTPKLRLPLMVTILVSISQQFIGGSAVLVYSTKMFQEAQLNDSMARYATLGLGLIYFLSTCLAPLLIEKIGRRSLYLFQLSSCLVMLTTFAALTRIQQFGPPLWISYCTIGVMVLYMCFYGVGSPIPWMITAELFEQKFRSAAVSVSVFTIYLLAFLVLLTYLPLQNIVGVTFSYLPFIAVSSLCLLLLYFYLPETKPKDEDIQEKIDGRSARMRTMSTISYGLP